MEDGNRQIQCQWKNKNKTIKWKKTEEKQEQNNNEKKKLSSVDRAEETL